MAKDRTFVRGINSETYSLNQFRQAQLAASRVRDDSVVTDTDDSATHSSGSATSRVWWRIGPGDEPFLTQTVQIHFVEIFPHGSNGGHGHQNEAAFYILEGKGYEVHDGQRYDWKAGDLVFVHTDSHHQHFNPYDEPAISLVMKAKSTWMFMGLIQQGKRAPVERPEDYGERVDWSQIWTPGMEEMKKVITPEDGAWEYTRLGHTRVMNSKEQVDHRQFSVDVYELTVPEAGRTGKYWKMADEVIYVLDGEGYSLHWEVQAEIDDRYYARIAKEPTRHDFKKGDILYIPQNTVAQHFAADGLPTHLLAVQNRIFKYLGYDNVHFFEDSPEYGTRLASAVAPG